MLALFEQGFRCGLNFGYSPGLFEHIKMIHPVTYLIGGGVDIHISVFTDYFCVIGLRIYL